MGNLYAIGDIHGCYDKLIELLGIIDIMPEEDTLIFMGDYVDRGERSYEVVDHLVRLQAEWPRTVFLKGNHEEMLLRYLEGLDRYLYLANGGLRTLESYIRHGGKNDRNPVSDIHMTFFSDLKLYHETEDFIFVHAGLKRDVPLQWQVPEDLLWIRETFIYSEHGFGKQVVFGHTPFTEPLVMPDKIGIDTGAVYGNKLTCVKLPEVSFFHA